MNILFINRSFFQYDRLIEQCMKKAGHKVYTYTTLPSLRYLRCVDFWKSLLSRRHAYRDNIVYSLALSQQNEMINELNKGEIKIDAVFVLSGQALRKETLSKLKEMYPQAIFLWYMWDNICFIKEYVDNKHYFDKLISFDINDAEKENIRFRPLFFSKRIKSDKKYLISHIGSAHPERVRILAKFKNKLDFDKSFVYLFATKEEMIRNKNLPGWKEMKPYIHSKSLNYEDVVRVMAESFATIDIPYEMQTGLTMRTIESIGFDTKLITTNLEVKKYDFYRENNIFIFDEEKMCMPNESFWKNKYENLTQELYKKYSLSGWVDYILNELSN